MREIVLDTETTGLNPLKGDKIVEIGCVELINHIPTGNTWHQYINPQRDMPAEAFAVHGLSEEFLSDKPVFSEIADKFLDFISSDKLIIHNASFDMGFINAELKAVKKLSVPDDQVIDSLALARKKFPMGPNSLDALCRRYGIDNSKRTKHGALLDSELLAEVYLELLGGRQQGFDLDANVDKKQSNRNRQSNHTGQTKALKRPIPLPSRLTEEEKINHEKAIEALGADSIWRKSVHQAPLDKL